MVYTRVRARLGTRGREKKIFFPAGRAADQASGAARGSGALPRPHLGVGETRSEGLALRPAVVNRPGRVYTAGAARRRWAAVGRSLRVRGGRTGRAREGADPGTDSPSGLERKTGPGAGLVANRHARSGARVRSGRVSCIRPSDRRGPGPAGHRGRNVRSTGRCSYNLRITRRRADSCGLHRSTSQVIRRSGSGV